MAKEIERKYLIKNNNWKQQVFKREHYIQAYLANNEHCSIRLRICNDKADLNIKSMTIGVMRDEYEYTIPTEDALAMIQSLCLKPYIEKTRHFLKHNEKMWEIDVFEKENAGLIIAEVELENPAEQIDLPEWVGQDVTEQQQYYNVCLQQKPYSEWNQ